VKWRWIKCGLIIGVLTGGFVLFGTAWRIYTFGQHHDVHSAEGAIVLGAAVWDDEPSPVFRERIRHGITLYETGAAPQLIFTGGSSWQDPTESAEALVGRYYAVAQGVPLTVTVVETHSHTTAQNLACALEVAPLESALIVSDPLHMRRAVRIARDLGLRAYSAPTPTTRYRSPGPKLRFLMRETYFYLRYRLARLLFGYHPRCPGG
jgi:uncharacterized SAM-binding protein YcdF (DUF218 family)